MLLIFVQKFSTILAEYLGKHFKNRFSCLSKWIRKKILGVWLGLNILPTPHLSIFRASIRDLSTCQRKRNPFELVLCKFTPMRACRNPLKDNLHFCPRTAQGKWWPQSYRSKAALGPRAAAAEPDFPWIFSFGISKAAKELDAGDVNIDRMTQVFSASLFLALPG